MRAPTAAGVTAAATGLATGIAGGFVALYGWPGAALFAAILAAVILAVLTLVPAPSRAQATRLALLVFAAHAAATFALHAGSIALGRGGYITGDDYGYAYTALCLVRHLTGDPLPFCVPPYWGGSAYLLGTWVYVEALLFHLLGPDVLYPKLLNAGFATLTAILVFDTARRLFGARSAVVAGAVVGLFPSIGVWAALNLKDGAVLLFIALALWAMVRFQLRPSPIAFALILVILLPIESLRRYVYVGLALLLPLTVLLTPRLSRRIIWVPVTSISAVVLVATAQVGFALGPGLFVAAEGSRGAMAVGARTSFQEPVAAAATQGVPPVPGTIMSPGATSGVPDQPPPSLGSPSDLRFDRLSDEPTDSLLVRTLRYLPRGLAYALFAPTPWMVSRPIEILTIPDMFLWYVVLAAALVSGWRERATWRSWSPLALFAVGLLLLLALAEGNVGTLYRHRAMLVPPVAILAAPTLVAALTRVRR